MEDNQIKYRIHSFIIHIGDSLNSGHYYIWTRNLLDPGWIQLNDSSSRKLKKQAYHIIITNPALFRPLLFRVSQLLAKVDIYKINNDHPLIPKNYNILCFSKMLMMSSVHSKKQISLIKNFFSFI
jgi:hypothetical protein